ncbi:alanine dehydrogenase [Geomesophilobacter sediminis]|uniref:Alanine dehydrogenase n=1 Tax=Geomesophilobacter sediminis TaxID=2798584 RepID=A0A8J7IR01_9BACT|nr:alanine dehydrogenase [Geomesophilobacter sediminis]MBJ6725194.1 alanine dehydrogenase [Geomesophilobacter sediminis]
MVIGIPKEVKKEEHRVALTPAGAVELVQAGHTVLVENGAGAGSGFSDDLYRQTGAQTVGRGDLFQRAEMIVKVKEPLVEEFDFFRSGQTLFTYLHLAPNRRLTEFLMERKIVALAYETLEKGGALPLLAPMSEVAGRMAPMLGAWCLQKVNGGTGVLPCGAVGVRPAKALILGAGTVGYNAARVALGMGMETVVLNRGIDRLQRIDELTGGRVRTGALVQENIKTEIADADLVVGAVLVPGGRPPLLIPRALLGAMKPGAVIVDVAVDQGGCAETTRPTFHDDPIYCVDGIIHYTVANMPGAYPRTSTVALTNATLPYVILLAQKGVDGALAQDPALATAVNVRDGKVVHPGLASSLASA